MNGSLLSEGGRYVLRFERHLGHSVERVWRALTEPSELAHWFPGETEMDLQLGGKVTFRHPGFEVDSELLPTDGTITELDPPRLFAFTWGEDLLRFELTPYAGGCVLVFTHSFESRASAPRSAAGWNVCIDSLEVALDGSTRSGESWYEYLDRYRDELGSDGTLTRDGDTAQLRFERVLDRPVEEVWDALTRPERLGDWLADVTIDAIEGGRVELRLGNPAGYVVTGTITRLDAPKVLEYTWTSPGEPDGVVKWQLIPAGERCILLFTHTLHGHWDEAGTLAAWHLHLGLLATALAGFPTWPFPDTRWHELHVRYSRAHEVG
ncbi:MAG: SRPBCC family protein [Acidimicrobiales bacterium]